MSDYDSHKRNSLAHGLGYRDDRGAPLPTGNVQYPTNENLWFNQKLIKLDGWCFVGCRFDSCRIVIETPYFVLRNCFIDNSSSIELQGFLVNAVQLLNLSPRNGANPAFQAIRNLDGTISIGC